MSRTPSRLTRWLLKTLTSTHEADAIVGDLVEELDARQATGRVRLPRLWLERQAWARHGRCGRLASVGDDLG